MLARSWFYRAILVCLVIAPPASAQEGIRWESNLETAQRMAKETNRLVLIHFGSNGCPPCRRLEQKVFSQPGFGKELDQYFVAVKLNCDHFPATARQFGVKTIPCDVILSSDGRLLQRLTSPSTANAYIDAMNQVAMEAHPQGGAHLTAQVTTNKAPAAGHAAASQTEASHVHPESSGTRSASSATDRYADYRNRRTRSAEIPRGPRPRSGDGQTCLPRGSAAPGQDEAQAEADLVQGFCTVPDEGMDDAADNTPADSMNEASTEPVDQRMADARGSLHDRGVAPPRTSLQGPSGKQPKPPGVSPRQSAGARPPRIPAGNPPLGMEGYCPVTLCHQQAWTMGDVRWGAIHRGRTYLFAGPEEQQKFLETPDQFSPVISGQDPVLALEQNKFVEGRREFGVWLDGRIYLFADPATRAAFEQDPSRYTAEALQARRTR